MQKLADRGHPVDIQILDNEVSAEFKKTIKNYSLYGRSEERRKDCNCK